MNTLVCLIINILSIKVTMSRNISLHTDLQIVKKAFPKLRDELKPLEYDYLTLKTIRLLLLPNIPLFIKTMKERSYDYVKWSGE